jgi:hypothetical protein
VKADQSAIFFNQEKNQARYQPKMYDSKAAMFYRVPYWTYLGLGLGRFERAEGFAL